MARKSQIGNDYFEEVLTVGPFGGIDDTTSPFFVAPSNFVEGSNFVPNAQYGGYVTVPGRVAALASLLPGQPYGIGCMQRAGQPDLYFFALDADGEGQIWTGTIGGTPTQLELPETLLPGARIAYFVPSRKWLFFTNGLNTPIKISTDLVATFWGIVAPSSAPTLVLSGAGPLIGSPYYYCETFSVADPSTGSDVQESSQGAISAPITATNNSITVTPTATTTDPQVTTRNLYRLGGSLGAWYLVHSQPVDDLTPYLDVLADADVDGQALVVFRDPPPIFIAIGSYQDRVFGFGIAPNDPNPDPTAVLWSNYNEPWGFNLDTNELEAGPNDFNDIAVTCGSIGSFFLLLKDRSTYAVIGNSDTTFTVIEVFPNIGCISPSSLIIGDNWAVWDALRGIQYFDGTNRLDIADGMFQQSNIKTFLKSLSLYDRQQSVGFYWDRIACMSYPSVNKTVMFDTRTSQWFMLDFALGAAYYDSNSVVPVVGSNLETIGEIDEWFASTTNGDLGEKIIASIKTRITDNGDISSNKSYRFTYIEAPAQAGAFVNVAFILNPGSEIDTPLWRKIPLDQSKTARQRWEMPLDLVGQSAQMQLQTVALTQVTLWRASLFAETVAKHQPSSPTDLGGQS